MKKIIISVTNDLSTDQRVDKVSNTLFKSGYSVLLVGRKLLSSKKLRNRAYDTYRFSMFFHRGVLFYLEYNIRLFFFLLIHKCDFLLSNDLDTLAANFLVSRIKKVKLIYDSHELFTELPELVNRPIKKFIWSSLEYLCLPRIKSAFTVSESISNFYRNKYGINMSVIYNFPMPQKINLDHNNSSKKTIIYQGSVNKDRGIELMIESMSFVNAKLLIVGSGDILEDLKQYVISLQLNHKVFFLGKVDFQDLFKITNTASLGLSFEKDSCLSYRYCLPNKIFDYINSGIPVLVSNLPEFKNIINNYRVGELLVSRDPRRVAEQINKLLSLPTQYWKNEILFAKKVYSWSKQEEKLLTFFQ